MIGTALRTDIERWAGRRDDNPVFQLARAGRFTHAMVTRYIANLTWMIHHTPQHMRQAAEGARARGDEALARHFEHKLEEEAGHAEWGEADLQRLAKQGSAGNTTVTHSIERLASYVTEAIDEDPALYLCYIAFAEYITVLLGPELLSLIEERNGVPRSSMTIVDNHVDLDRDHAEEAFGVIDDLVDDPKSMARMREGLAEIIEIFDGFCVELASDGGIRDESEPRLRSNVVSAA